MPAKKNYYEILGVEKTATAEQIKLRYRQLVRQYHPDVAQDKAIAKTAFIEIAEAYQTLINPNKRLIYDTSVGLQAPRMQPPRPPSPGASGTPRPRSRQAQTQSPPKSRTAEAERYVREAQAVFARGQFRSAILACKEAQRLDPRNVQAHIILGDIHRIQGRIEDAIAMYTIAVQLDPRNTDVQAKLDRLARRSSDGEPGLSSEQKASLRMGLNLIGWSIGAALLILLALGPGEPIAWLRQHLTMVDRWSRMLIAVLLAGGMLTGFLLSVNEAVEHLDEELIFNVVRSPGPRPASYPIGLLLLLFSFFSFYIAAAVYMIIGSVQESLSKSVLRVLIATFALVAMISLVYGSGGLQVLLFGGNLALPAVLFGWLIGDMVRSS